MDPASNAALDRFRRRSASKIEREIFEEGGTPLGKVNRREGIVGDRSSSVPMLVALSCNFTLTSSRRQGFE